MAFTFRPHHLLTAAVAICAATSLGGCTQSSQAVENIFNYLNLRNGFLDPSEVGRFDKSSPWGAFGPTKPVTWPILESLDVIDEPNESWAHATEPLPSDIVVNTKEYVLGEGDLVRVSVYELVTPGMEYQRESQVNELGVISLMNIGPIQVGGLTPSELEAKIGQVAIEKGFLLPKGDGNPGPQVGVTLLQSRARVFSIIGNAGAPGTYQIIGTDFRLLHALAMARDVAGGTQPGMDYLYVIRPPKGAGVIPALPTSVTPLTPAPAKNPLDAIDTIEGTTKPAPATEPKPPVNPGAEGPQFLRELPKAVVMSPESPTLLAQADLDAALGGRPAGAAAVTPPATAPAGSETVAPSTPVAGPSSDPMMNQVVGGADGRPGYIYVDGKWVAVSPSGSGSMTSAESTAAASGLTNPRTIRIPIDALREGNPKYNIVIQPGDIIHIPNIQPGEFYMIGHIGRPGVFSLSGRKVTLKQAVSAAGGLDKLAIPRKCDLTRRIGPNQEVTVQVDLQRIFDGEQPDIFLKANDLVNIGSDMVAPFLAVTRNAYRASYGWGFVYDRNLYQQVNLTQSVGQ